MNNNLKIICTTHDKFSWALQPFMYLFHAYWSATQPVTILGENNPVFNLAPNFDFYSVVVADEPKWPKDKWTNGLVKYLHSIREQYVVIFLDDFWLNRKVDIDGVQILYEYMLQNKQVLRMDLTMDRLFATGPKYPHDDDGNYGHHDRFDLISRPGTQYQMSLQPAIWNKSLLFQVLQGGWSPWEFELSGTRMVNERQDDIVVLGTRQNLVSFTNALKNEATGVYTGGLPSEHLNQIEKWFPKQEIV